MPVRRAKCQKRRALARESSMLMAMANGSRLAAAGGTATLSGGARYQTSGRGPTMDISVVQGDISTTEADVVIVNLFEGVTSPGGATGAVDRALDGAISQLIELGDIRGKAGERTTIHTFGKIPAPRVLVAGLGKADDFDVHAVRNLSAEVARACRRPGVNTVATVVHGAGIGGLDPDACAQAVAEGAILGAYQFLRYKTESDDDDDKAAIGKLTIVEHDASKVEGMAAAANRGRVMAEATNLARDLANEPANNLNPTDLAGRAAEVASAPNLELEVMEEEEMEAKGMGSLLSVARGSVQPAKLVRISYKGRGGKGYDLALVGKGITFDTGGISIKPAQGMEAMKADMTGAASVIAAMQAVAALAPKADILAIAPCTENMPGGNATRPGDVVSAMNGKTIEILNTDAEGRLVLADGLCYARELGARHLVDVATLTGAISVALGDQCYGLMTNDDALAKRFEAAAEAAGERSWRLPMFKEYGEQLKSNVSVVKNIGGRPAGSITAAKFLEHFVDEKPWVHLDIAGVDMASKNKGWITKGASGQVVRALVNLAVGFADE
ncbi:MAG: leucyl aminopeptidase [Dehalococcoidia bacterium]|nr:leucyl aminopeptidase [Dehalococcoidia bacterium]